jgi:hypothetical protein
MKRTFAMVAAIALVSPAFGASVIIDATHGKKVYIGNFYPEIPFTSQLLRGSPTTFGVSFDGLIGADSRWCSSLPPWEIPPDCLNPIDPIHWSDTFVADTDWPTSQEFLVPVFDGGVEGYLYFGPTDGGRVLITVNGRALPEPASWAMMLGGFGAIGGAMRARRRVAVSFG